MYVYINFAFKITCHLYSLNCIIVKFKWLVDFQKVRNYHLYYDKIINAYLLLK